MFWLWLLARKVFQLWKFESEFPLFAIHVCTNNYILKESGFLFSLRRPVDLHNVFIWVIVILGGMDFLESYMCHE